MDRIAVLLLVLVFLTVPSMAIAQPAASPAETAENSWTTMADMPTPRLGAGVAVVNGKIYAIGGRMSGDCLSTNEEYDPITNTWTTRKPMPTPRGEFAIAVYQNKIYVIGGGGDFDLEEVTGINEVYDPSTDTWTTKTPMPTPREFLCANVVNGKIYLIGGSKPWMQGKAPVPNVNEVYDPSTDSWTNKTPPPTQVDLYASAVFDNKIFIIGGTVVGNISNLTQVYHPETDTWTSGTPIPNAAWGAAAAATTGVAAPRRIYVIGGNPTFNLNQVYDPITDVWTTGAPMPTNRYGFGIAVVNDLLYAIGAYWQNERYVPFGFFGTVPPDTTPPTIFIVSPENKTYTVNNVSLTFNISEQTSWISYSLDGQANVAIIGNITLFGLSEGSHSLIVYAEDVAGNTGASETIYFTIAQQSGPTQPSEPFPTTWIAIVIVIVAAAGMGLLVYFKKRKH